MTLNDNSRRQEMSFCGDDDRWLNTSRVERLYHLDDDDDDSRSHASIPLNNRVANPQIDDEKHLPNGKLAHHSPRTHFRKMLLIYAGLLLMTYACWRLRLLPSWTDRRSSVKEVLQPAANNTYGVAGGGSFDGTKIMDLDSSLIPGGVQDPHGNRRLVFVGDIHGCKAELQHLLSKIGFNEHTDHLIAAGDMISKGEDSPGVLSELIRMKASGVRGNHEDRILHIAKTVSDDQEDMQSVTDVDSNSRAEKDKKLLKQLSKQHLRYLRDLPLILRIPPLPSASQNKKHHGDKKHRHIAEGLLVVHAGLVPGIALEAQDPYFVMNMRSINRRTRKPSSAHDKDLPWYTVWNWYQSKIDSSGALLEEESSGDELSIDPSLPSESWKDKLSSTDWAGQNKPPLKPHVVVYGHDSRSGLQIHRWSKGLDTGCVRGGALTAMILDATGSVEYEKVKCRDHRS